MPRRNDPRFPRRRDVIPAWERKAREQVADLIDEAEEQAWERLAAVVAPAPKPDPIDVARAAYDYWSSRLHTLAIVPLRDWL